MNSSEEADPDLASIGVRASAERMPLDTERIVAAAIEFIDEFDLRDLTMRRLGSALGVEAMALYRYVPSRDDLLDLVVASIIDEMNHDPEVLAAPQNGWQDFLQRLAHGVRKIALAHPMAFPLVASRPPKRRGYGRPCAVSPGSSPSCAR
ncbi:MAG: TetR family transcriptional regulator [Nocardioidaceae bacterium]